MSSIKKNKGKIIVAVASIVLGIGAITAAIGVEVVDGPEGAICIAAVEATE